MTSEIPHIRRRPTKAKQLGVERNSNIVRASVLETALELGFGQNSTVAHWIFNNPLSEEAEEYHPGPDIKCKSDANLEPAAEIAEATTPTFTSGPNSISDESSSLNSPGNSAPSAAITAIQVHKHKPSVTESPHVHFGDFSSDHLQLFSPFALSPHDAHLPERSSLSVKLSRDNERSRSQDDSFCRNPNHVTPNHPGPADAGYASEGQYLLKGKTGKGKDKASKPKGKGGSRNKAVDNSKNSEKDGDYTSDGGYISASSNKSQGKSSGRVKSRAMSFFRRRPKKNASDDEDEDCIPPVPALPAFPTPSSPKRLERHLAPMSPTRSGFSPLTLNMTSPPASPPRRVSKSPPPAHGRATPPQRLDHNSAPQRPASPLAASTPTIQTPATTAATIPLPPSAPGTPLSATSLPTTTTQKSLTTSSSRQHLSIPPQAPPPTLPLPQLPPSPTSSSNGTLPTSPVTQTTPARRGVSTRPIHVAPMSTGSVPLVSHRTASPFRPLLSPRASSPAIPHTRNGELTNGCEVDKFREFNGRQRSGTALTAGLGSTPAFLQRKIQHGPPLSPRLPPPDVPLPPSPSPALGTLPRTPVGAPSKFHEHFSSVASVAMSPPILSPPVSMSPSPSTATLSESSSGLSVRSSHISSLSVRSEGLVIGDSLSVTDYSRPTTSASTISESSYGQPIPSTLSRPAMDFQSQFSRRSDLSSSMYSSTMIRDSSSVTTYDDDADVDDAVSGSCVDMDDDDASLYPSEDKTAGRRTMYLVEHGELDENGDEIVINGSRFWGDREVPPPLPPLPPMPARPGPGYF